MFASLRTTNSVSSGSLSSADSPRSRSEPFDWAACLYAGIWLTFLIHPLYAIFQYQDASEMRALGVVSIALFSLIYLCSFGKPTLAPGSTKTRRTLFWTFLLLLPTIGMFITAHSYTFSATTYIVALWVFSLDSWSGFPVGLFILAVAIAFSEFFYPGFLSSSTLWMFAGCFFVLVIAYLNKRDEVNSHLREQARRAEEREAIASDVHDILGHSLTVISLKAEVAQRLMESDPQRAREEIEAISSLSRTCLTQVRATVTRLKAPDLIGEVRAAAIALEAAGIKAELPSDEEIRRAQSTNSSLFAAVLRESITNVVRHSQASLCSVRIEAERLEIVDNGIGFPHLASLTSQKTTSEKQRPTLHSENLGNVGDPGEQSIWKTAGQGRKQTAGQGRKQTAGQDGKPTTGQNTRPTTELDVKESTSQGNGIAGMSKRVESAGGNLIIESPYPTQNTGSFLYEKEYLGTRVLVTMNGDTSPLGS